MIPDVALLPEAGELCNVVGVKLLRSLLFLYRGCIKAEISSTASVMPSTRKEWQAWAVH